MPYWRHGSRLTGCTEGTGGNAVPGYRVHRPVEVSSSVLSDA